jgi:glyoxylase-like metal-dependent hydrolase (beta-lactamase superfamily II)
VLVRHVTATAFGTNCWVLAAGPGAPCLVVDPGFGVTRPLHRLLLADRLRPAALLVTHGHADHVWSVTPLSRSADPPLAVLVHPGDRPRLRDPLAQLGTAFGADLVPMLTAHLGPEATWAEPESVVDLPDAGGDEVVLPVAGLEVGVRHTPGHTEGSACFRLPRSAPGGADVLLTGDLLFAGSIGRTDLPGADPVAMTRSLDTVMAAHADDTVVLPGHGPTTTVGAERATNPFLAGMAAGGDRTGGAR